MSPKHKAVIVAVLFALAGLVGYTVTPAASNEPVPPVLTPPVTASSTTTLPPDPPSPPPVDTGCVAPAGMTKLEDQVPISQDSQLPWRRNGQPKVTIHFAVKGVPESWRPHVAYGQAAWNKSPCLDVRVVEVCPTGSNCVPVAVVKNADGADGNFDAVEKNGYTVSGRITLLASLSPGEAKNVTVHEMGHAVSLAHRKTKRVLMNEDTYSDVFDPDATDYRNLAFLYGRQK